MKERQGLEKENLCDQGIFHHFDADRMHKASALILGPEGTPYAHGFYLFRFTFPNNYPAEPPRVGFWTGDGRVRFHPNLYTTGKVCLSILGTWDGPSWTSACSFRTTLLSLQSLLCSCPLMNEPGYEDGCGEEGDDYAAIIRYENIAVSVLNLEQASPAQLAPLRAAMTRRFLQNYQHYVQALEEFDVLEGCSKECPVYGFVTEFHPGAVRQRLEELRDAASADEEQASSTSSSDACNAGPSRRQLAAAVLRATFARVAFARESKASADSACDAAWSEMEADLLALGNEERAFSSLGGAARDGPAQQAVAAAQRACHSDECPICLQRPERPLELPCGHVFCADCLLEVVAEYGKRECPCCRGALTTGKSMMPSYSESGYYDGVSDIDAVVEPTRGFTWHRFIFGWFFYCSVTKSDYRDVDYLDTFRESLPPSARSILESLPSSARSASFPPVPMSSFSVPYAANDKDAVLDELVRIMAIDVQSARRTLETCSWDLHAAIEVRLAGKSSEELPHVE